MTEFESYVSDIPCIVRVTYWEPYLPAIIRADPGDSHPEEGGCGEWEILHLDGQPYPELESEMTGKDLADLEHTVFQHMENQYDTD
jgi:hypothetical protein